jgi:hypothetical protein
MTHSPETADYWREQDRDMVEATASGVTSPSGTINMRQLGLARVELNRRNREYAEQQEQSRRDFESALADKQLSAATDVANATKWAMVAAFFAAFDAIIQAVVAVGEKLHRARC